MESNAVNPGTVSTSPSIDPSVPVIGLGIGIIYVIIPLLVVVFALFVRGRRYDDLTRPPALKNSRPARVSPR